MNSSNLWVSRSKLTPFYHANVAITSVSTSQNLAGFSEARWIFIDLPRVSANLQIRDVRFPYLWNAPPHSISSTSIHSPSAFPDLPPFFFLVTGASISQSTPRIPKDLAGAGELTSHNNLPFLLHRSLNGSLSSMSRRLLQLPCFLTRYWRQGAAGRVQDAAHRGAPGILGDLVFGVLLLDFSARGDLAGFCWGRWGFLLMAWWAINRGF